MRLLLQRVHDAKDILRARIATRGQHAVQAFARLLEHRREFLEPDRGVDKIAQHRLACRRLADQIGIDRLGKQRFQKSWVLSDSRGHCVFKFSGECHCASVQCEESFRRRCVEPFHPFSKGRTTPPLNTVRSLPCPLAPHPALQTSSAPGVPNPERQIQDRPCRDGLAPRYVLQNSVRWIILQPQHARISKDGSHAINDGRDRFYAPDVYTFPHSYNLSWAQVTGSLFQSLIWEYRRDQCPGLG
jgi:hypothetical protein